MADPESLVVFVGTFLPLVGSGLTVLLAVVTRGLSRWVILLTVPAITMLASYSLSYVVWKDGNMLAAVLALGFMAGLIVYYPILLVWGLIALKRKGRQ